MEKLLFAPNTDKNGYKLCMAYPAKEEFALSSLGYLWLYKTASTFNGITAQRLSTDSPPKEFNIKNVDSISFSMSFDFDFTGVFEVLQKFGIPLYANERDEKSPLIFAGGPVITTNPKPFSNLFDFMIIGDGEECIKTVLEILNKGVNKGVNKGQILTKLSKIKGIYVPGVNDVIDNGINACVEKVTERLENVIYTPIISDKSYFKDTFIIEVSRGCYNRCAFCTASYLNLPYRYYEYQKIIDAIDLGLKYTNKIALLGAQVSAHPDFKKIMSYLEEKIDTVGIEIGISSLRTDAITPELIKILVKGGQKTSTIAIEAASERLRKFINKNLSEEQILNAVKISRENGLKGLKIYSMLGLPTETQQDIKEFVTLAKKIKAENKGFDITFSFSTFIPKPQTPFQRSARENTKSLEKKQKYLEKEFAKLGISSKFSSPKWDYLQTIISRGDEKILPLLIEAYKNGGKIGDYKKAAKKLNIDFDEYTKELENNIILPWDFILNNITKEQLKNEYKRLSNNSL